MELFLVVLFLGGGYFLYKYKTKKNSNILDRDLPPHHTNRIYKEEDGSKAIIVDEPNKKVDFFQVVDGRLEKYSIPISQIKNVELLEDINKDNNCKSIRLKFEIDSIDFPLFQITFLSDSWNNVIKATLYKDGFEQSSNEYLKASQQANKFLKLISSLQSS